jgi:hypothetical protein
MLVTQKGNGQLSRLAQPGFLLKQGLKGCVTAQTKPKPINQTIQATQTNQFYLEEKHANQKVILPIFHSLSADIAAGAAVARLG